MSEPILPNNLLKVKTHHLRPTCEKCFGLCCVALFFSEQDGFPIDKNAGTPCPHLESNFHCDTYDSLETLGLKGCISYDCFGAGQRVSQITFCGKSWSVEHSLAQTMFEVFPIMRQLHEMCWYLTEALTLKQSLSIHSELNALLCETESVARYDALSLLAFDLTTHRTKVNTLLRETSEYVRSDAYHNAANSVKKSQTITDLAGKDLRRDDLRYADFRGVCLIAVNLEGVDLTGVNFIGADLRDANLKGANLSKSFFLTQFQINTAKGDLNTQLPLMLNRPKQWL